jgi:hypothetical protein
MEVIKSEYDNMVESLMGELKKSGNYYVNRKNGIIFFICEDKLYGIKEFILDKVEHPFIKEYKDNYIVWEEVCDFRIDPSDNKIKKYELIKKQSTDYGLIDYEELVEIFSNINMLNHFKDLEEYDI